MILKNVKKIDKIVRKIGNKHNRIIEHTISNLCSINIYNIVTLIGTLCIIIIGNTNFRRFLKSELRIFGTYKIEY